MLSQYLFIAGVCFLTGYIPSVSTEVILAGVGLTISLKHVLPLAALGAATQTIAKLNLYLLAKKVIPFLSFRKLRKLVKLKKRFRTREKLSNSIIFISSLTGLPPYYFINLLCGILNTGVKTFALLGFAGMFIRFSLCLAFPHLILQWFK